MKDLEVIRELLGQGKIKKAIRLLENSESEFNNIILSLKSRLNILENKELSGIISNDNSNLERNSILHSLLNVISKIENESSIIMPILNLINKENFEKIIGRNGLKSIDWLSKGMEKAKSVCKIHTSDGYVGTGFLVNDGFIFTNNHVIGSASIAQFSKVEFGYDSPEVSSVFYDLDHSNFFTSDIYDYTKVKVKDTHPKVKLSHWGQLQINYDTPNKNDALIIIQHPQGRRKELAFSDGENSIWDYRLHYKVTTEPGSSGSPVFDIEWNVVALHHAGGNIKINPKGDTRYVNEGILFNYIKEDLGKNSNQDKEVNNVKPETNFGKPVKSILVYNSKDSEYADGLFSHLYTQIRNGNITLFDIQKDIPPDANKDEMLSNEIESSTMILVLISKNLYRRETLNLALNVEKQVSVKRVIPIRVSPFDLNGTPFETLQGLPLNGKAISDFNDIDNILYEMVNSISRVIKEIIKKAKR